MRAYSIFDDFTDDARETLEKVGIEVTVHPLGKPRPNKEEFRTILETYDIAIIGTSQKIQEDDFNNIEVPKIIGTASVGMDHINIPDEKKTLIKVLNTPKANAQSVAEYTFAAALGFRKRLIEGCRLYVSGRNNKALRKKPEDLFGATIGVVGAGNISAKIMKFAHIFGMHIICYTTHPENHQNLTNTYDVRFVSLLELARNADIVSVNLPNTEGTREIISSDFVNLLKRDAIYISVSRKETQDVFALLQKAKKNPNFYVCLDLDVDDSIASKYELSDNIVITPHIAGGTVATRKRMFKEVADRIVDAVYENDLQRVIKQ